MMFYWTVFGALGVLLAFILIRPFWHGLTERSRWVRKWTMRLLKGGAMALVCLAVLIPLFYVEEDWRGKRAWEQCKAQLEAKGEKLDWKDFIPPPVPDDKNFALTPIVASSYGAYMDTNGKAISPTNTAVVTDRLTMNEIDSMLQTSSPWTNGADPFGEWHKGEKIDLKAWQTCLRGAFITNSGQITNVFPMTPRPRTPAADVLLALSKYDATFEGLRQASRMPYSRFPLNYNTDDPRRDMIVPQWESFESCMRVLSLRASAELENGQSDAALADVTLILYLMNSLPHEYLIEIETGTSFLNCALQPVWEGLVGNKWSADQLAAMQRQFAEVDLLADYDTEMRAGRMMGVRAIESERRTHDIDDKDNDEIEPQERLIMFYHRLFPQGWYYQNEVVLAEVCQQTLRTETEVKGHILSPEIAQRTQSAGDLIEKYNNWPYYYYVEMFSPMLEFEFPRLAFQQNAVDLARVACALERYRLKHGGYPETLDALAPELMEAAPTDVINGKPLHYHRTADGKFLLYSVGWNERDDGGVSSINDASGEAVYADGDWVWPTAAQ
jgi:hypothetical protein